MHNSKNHLSFFSSSRMRYFLKIFIPILATLILIMLIVFLNFYQSKQQSKKSSLYSMETFSMYCENTIKNSLNNCTLLESNSEISKLLDTNKSFTSFNHTSSSLWLKSFLESNNIIYSTAIINKVHGEVISQDGLFSMSDYFNKNFILHGYKDTYWSNFRIYDLSPYKIMPPVYCEYNGKKIPVIPIIFRELKKPHSNYLLITLSLNSIAQNSTPLLSFTDNTELYILNRYTGSSFNLTKNFEITQLNGTNMYLKMMKGASGFDTKNSKGLKSVLFSYSSTDKILGYTYYTIIPYKDINKSQIPNIIITSLLIIITLIITLILTNKNVNDYFTPIQKMENALSKNTIIKKEKNHIHNIADAVNDVISKYNKIENILPYAQEQYLINYLNDSTICFDRDKLKDELLSTLPFSHSRFAVVIVQISPTQRFFNEFSKTEYENIYAGFFSIIKSMFTNFFNPFFLSVEKESTYIIINTDEKFIDDKIEEISASIKELLKNDTDYVELYIATGELHDGIEGLRISHTEALRKLSEFPLVKPKSIRTTNKSTTNGFFSADNEFLLLNMLIANDIDSAANLIHDIADAYLYNDEALIQAYHKILSVIFKAMYIKNISVSDNDKPEFEFYLELFSETPNMLYKRIMMLLSKFRGNIKNTVENLSDEISKFILDNYHDNSLSLDKLSDMLKLDKRSLSSAIKNFYGISFHSYLENIRIEKAKSMLSQTNKTIQAIYEETGFTNKQTFIRSFKKITGYTPSHYRQNSSNTY